MIVQKTISLFSVEIMFIGAIISHPVLSSGSYSILYSLLCISFTAMLISVFVIFGCSSTLRNRINMSVLYFIIGSLHSVSFTLFISSLFKSLYFYLHDIINRNGTILLSLVVNAIGLLFYLFKSNTSLFFIFIPANVYYILTYHLLSPTAFTFSFFATSMVLSLVISLIYLIATILIWYWRFSLFNTLDKVCELTVFSLVLPEAVNHSYCRFSQSDSRHGR